MSGARTCASYGSRARTNVVTKNFSGRWRDSSRDEFWHDPQIGVDVLASVFETVYETHPNSGHTGDDPDSKLLRALCDVNIAPEYRAYAFLRAAGAVSMHEFSLQDLFEELSDHLFNDALEPGQIRHRLAQVRDDLPAALASSALWPGLRDRFETRLFETINRLPRELAKVERKLTLAAFDAFYRKQGAHNDTRMTLLHRRRRSRAGASVTPDWSFRNRASQPLPQSRSGTFSVPDSGCGWSGTNNMLDLRRR